MMKKTAIAAALIAMSGAACATTDGNSEASEEVAARLAEFEPTGETTACVNLTRIRSIDPLDDYRFLVRTGVNDYYLNEVSGRCNGAARAGNRLQYTTSTGQLCRNEIIEVVDNLAGFTVGSCGLGTFQELAKKPEEAE
ncbi:MAG: hypothetical protein CMI63_00045 [Parvularcula sp.]|uniref:DUF6491 family protein n=1 Tax=Hyphococcus sp. TaxID=2038636 RepID=UPI000C39255C|nr:hypothetical protein [Parvularcula sp.]